ncbi:Hemolysin-III related subfamily protein [Acanthamoeba castellanii str. Neff]|uniref:Hemolysin-III related subfamily protein n=1 Tax=Acanthamoeba castellanii (strain ATCC 30010 / Neff) TaxID=1257118 RepID=L8HH88_ACACF|nr:Hemolysin-III related subfamily protein [Acanthamoeba castellanii str. Neff]ELR23816.1 Hemolysin-III related subfamily protein [Acanthamoeba castellanii str. Neff]
MKDQRVIADNASATAANNGRQVELSAKNKAETSFTKISLLDICLEDNPYLRSGYREMGKKDACACVCSAFALHNETVNIWTHGLAFLMFAGLVLENLLSTANMPFYDRVVFLVYLGCVSTCFFISTFYHVFRNHSVRAYANWLIADINGVGLYIFGSVLLVAYFRFWCHDVHRWTYMTLDVMLYLSFSYRCRPSSSTSSSTCVPGCSVFSPSSACGPTSTPTSATGRNLKLVWVAVCVIGSMVIRNKKVPERWYPGRFDIFFASHQIFHVLVWLGMCILYSVFYSEFGPTSLTADNGRTCPTSLSL